MSGRQKTYCNNCDMQGHSFSNCRKPIISNGIITYRIGSKNNLEYLLVCRKHTFGYIDFLRGKYALNNKTHIKTIIHEMTNDEKNKIRRLTFLELWLDLWDSNTNAYFINEKIFASEKFNMLSKGIYIYSGMYTIHTLLDECTSNWVTPEWGFPKGRKNFKETNKECATFDEVVIGSNYQSYKDIFYLGKFTGDASKSIQYQKLELSSAKWCSIDEVCDKIRPYHLERKHIIKKVDCLLNKYSQYIYG